MSFFPHNPNHLKNITQPRKHEKNNAIATLFSWKMIMIFTYFALMNIISANG